MTCFFGREKELQFLQENFFVTKPGTGYCATLNGPNGSGKTMLVKRAADEFAKQEHPNVYYFDTAIEETSSFWRFWRKLIRKFARSIPEEKLRAAPNPEPGLIDVVLEAYHFFQDEDNTNDIGSIWYAEDANEHLNFIFDAYTGLGIHILITIDEFDEAATAFPVSSNDGSFFQRLFLLSPKSCNEYKLSILLIARRDIGTIAHHMANGSSLPEAYQADIVLRGFNEQELEQHFASYGELPCGIPTEEQRERIHYFCGRHPGLLMEMRKLLKQHYEVGKALIPDKLYDDYRQNIEIHYQRMTTLLRELFVDQEHGRSCLGIFSQLFVGPAYDPNLEEHLKKLHQYGLLTRLNQIDEGGFERFGKSVFQLSGMKEDAFTCEPISPYYIEYFKKHVKLAERDELDRLMTETELKVRDGIKKMMRARYSDAWEEELEKVVPNLKQRFKERLDQTARENDAALRGVSWSILDVLAFDDYADIIDTSWEIMRLYFRSFSSPEELKEAFQVLTGGRNCFCHKNGAILNETSRKRLTKLCRTLIEDYDKGERGIPVEEDGASASPLPYEAVMPTQEQIKALRGQKVKFCYKGKRKSGRIYGILQGTNFPAGIPKDRQEGFDQNISQKGAVIEAVVNQWEKSIEEFNLVAPGTELPGWGKET